ncbi:MAG: saccharopine dehydrogenase C-terminal domain-containing protein [Paenalcaligenes sp.]
MKIVLLGAGHIGQSIAHHLTHSGHYQLVVVDQHEQALQPVAQRGISTQVVNLRDAQALETLLRDTDAQTVINALPFHMAKHVSAAAVKHGRHYFDLTEDVQATQHMMALGKGASTVLMPQCGLAPGFVGVAAHSLAAEFDDVQHLKLRVGALPRNPDNRLMYNLTWSIDGLINEYRHPCEALRDGESVSIMPMEGLENLHADGVLYEAFNTSGGLGTLCSTLKGKAQNLDYKSIRYPGHHNYMQFLLDDLQLRTQPDVLKDLLMKAIPRTYDDMVLVVVSASGRKNGVLQEQKLMRCVHSAQTSFGYESAIQQTTTSGLCVAVDLFRQGKLPQSGFVGQEAIALTDFLANEFARPYQQ